MKEEKDESSHFRLTKTRNYSVKDLADQLDRIEHGLNFLIRNTFKDARIVQGLWLRYPPKEPQRYAGFGGPK